MRRGDIASPDLKGIGGARSSPHRRLRAAGAISTLLACSLGLPALVSCTGAGADPAAGAGGPPRDTSPADRRSEDAGTVGVAAVTRGSVTDTFLLTGELQAVDAIEITAPRSDTWRVQVKWLAEDGSLVKAGDPIVEFDNTAVVSRLEEMRLAYLQSEISLESRRASLVSEEDDKRLALERALHEEERARIQAEVPEELSRRSEWFENQEAFKRASAAVAKARLALDAFHVSSRSELDVLEIERDKAARNIAEAERLLSQLGSKAQRDGIFIVGENWQEGRKFQVGDTAWPGMTVGSIPDLSRMEVRAWLSDVDDGRVLPGMTARCILDTWPDRVFPGRVESIASLAGDRGFLVRVSLQDSDPEMMRPGMSARIEIARREWEDALTVPRRAVAWAGGRSIVFLREDEDPVEVVLAGCTPENCVVESGLSEGERVLVR